MPRSDAAVSYLQALFDYLRLHGVAAQEILGGVQVDLGDRDARVEESVAAGLFNRAAERLGDDTLGLHAGELIRPGHYGVVGYIGMSCATLGEAMLALQRYQSMVLDVGALPPQVKGTEVQLGWRPDDQSHYYRHMAEFNLTALVTFIRWLTGRPLQPLRIEFPYPAPARLDEQRRVFACPLQFAADCYRLVVPVDWSELPLIQPDPAMRQLMDRLAEKQLLELRRSDDDLVAQARRRLAQSLSEGEASLDRIAGALNVSPRSLQRKLQDQGSSFSQLLDEVRRELAERYLEDRALDLTDLAFLLGYSEQSAFTRAFKRWTGRAPAEHRAALRAR
ncbi:MAG TPA: AraC family transcriptional regulator [Solimonas sp.]|nr:AraC family transcriptional regulator [Solimonas sp.]